MTDTSVIYTIGHGTDSFDEFLDRITPHGVTMVVDVRSHPVSRHAPEFVKKELELAAAEAGIGYRWLGTALGGRAGDDMLDASGSPDWDRIRSTHNFRGGIAQLVGLSRTSTVVIMCGELDPRHCHRSLVIAPELTDTGLGVVDILADGTTAPHQPPLV